MFGNSEKKLEKIAYLGLNGFVLGAVAQLGERYNGIVEVRGSIPLGSTTSLLQNWSYDSEE